MDGRSHRLHREKHLQRILGKFPNEFAKHGHTDRWLLKPSKYRSTTWAWMNAAASIRKTATGSPN